MKCPNCQKEMQQAGTQPFQMDRGVCGDGCFACHVTVDDVPYWQCSECGDAKITATTDVEKAQKTIAVMAGVLQKFLDRE